MKRIRKMILAVLIIIVLFVLALPYIRVEYLTFRYGTEFAQLEQQTNMLHDSRYLKVFEYSEDEATVFYASNTGDMITFVKDGDTWKLETWKTIWSKTGSADEFVWPYYR
ncbi:MAG: hypothetical protein IJ333_09780 [Clostridia bacterium]|nr:hypothetical protein [Clostridia bacterium]